MRRFSMLITILMVGFTLLVGVMRVVGQNQPALSGFSPTCHAGGEFGSTPCFLGITAGDTDIITARDHLLSNTWVRQVDDRMRMDYFGYEHLVFRWHPSHGSGAILTTPGEQVIPVGLGEAARSSTGNAWVGELVTSYGKVYVVRLQAGVRFGDLWMALGQPAFSTFSATPYRRSAVPAMRLHSTLFADNTVTTAIILSCPVTLSSLLESEVYLVELRTRNFIVEDRDPSSTSAGGLLRHIRTSGAC
jgi:hypothetical protein